MSSDGTPKYSPQLINSIVGAIGDYNTVNIQQPLGQPAPYQLPLVVKDFTGREQELDEITVAVQQHGIVALHGMGGVGKSALAIAVAHRLRADFPDAHLYANLYGQSQPLDAQAVLIRLLRALTGQNESQLPTDLEGLQGVYRSVLAEKRALIVLDNARDASHVVPLLAGEGCGVILTSRQTLSLSGAQSIRLGAMKLDEAMELLERISQRIVVDAERSVAMQIVGNCGRLPLAVRIVGALLHRRSQVSLAEVAAELRDERDRLTTLATQHGKLGTDEYLDVRSSFELSYRGLIPEQKAVFAQVSTLPGIDFGLAVAAAVTEQPEDNLREWLDTLADEQLVQVSPERRYEFHDLMRLFAREQLAEEEQKALTERAVTWYSEGADFRNDGLDPIRLRELAQAQAEITENTQEEWEQALPRMALNWFVAEQKNWVDVVRQLAKLQRVRDAAALTANLVPFFNLRSVWGDWVTTHEIAKACAEQADDIYRVAYILTNLGLVYHKQGRWDDAIDCYEKSLATWQDLGDSDGIARTRVNLGSVYQDQGRWDEAITTYEQSLKTFRDKSNSHSIAQALTNLGLIYYKRGYWNEAISAYAQSLQTFRDLGDRHGEGQTLNNLGLVYAQQGSLDKAIVAYEQSIQISQDIGNSRSTATTRMNLGSVYGQQGRWDEAITAFEQSLQIFHVLGDIHRISTVLAHLGVVYRLQGRWDNAITAFEQSLQARRDLGDTHGIAEILNSLGVVYCYQGRWDEAITAHEQSMQTFHDLDDSPSIASSLMSLGLVHHQQGCWDKAISFYEQSLEIFRELGDNNSVARTFTNLGSVYRRQGCREEAITAFEQSLQISRDLGDSHATAQALGNLGNVYNDLRRWEEAITAHEQSLQICRDLGDRHGEGQTLANLGSLHQQRNQPAQAKALWQQALTKINPDSPDFQAVQQWIEELEVKNAKLKMGCGYGLLVGGIVAFLLVCLFKGQWIMAGFGLLVLGGLWARKLSRARIRKSHKSRQED